MKYIMWIVFSNKGAKQDYYVVNSDSKQVQSVWHNLLEARAVCDKLNKMVKKEIA